ncbi:MAG: Gx transporter family protein [Firmicutes bacterium]|nr:Gx transporter family protein [Bacillota bacterium]
MNGQQEQTRKLLNLSLLAAGGTVLHALESYLPALSTLPGAKLGLANIASMLALIWYSAGDACKVVVLRVLLGSLLAGIFFTPSFFLSVAGAAGSFGAMAAAIYMSGGALSIIGISILGAVAHNLAQLLMAMLLARSWGVVFYLPWLLLFALPTGYFVGLLSTLVVRLVPFSFRLPLITTGKNRQDLTCKCRICRWSPHLPKED